MFNRHEYIKERRIFKLQNNPEALRLIEEITAKEYAIDDDFTRGGIIAREVNVTTWQSFCRFGDRNCSSKTFRRNWIRDKAIALDVQAMFITEEYSFEILPEELAEFMMQHEAGKDQYKPFEELNNLKKAFNELTGFRWDWNPKFFRKQLQKQEEKEEKYIF